MENIFDKELASAFKFENIENKFWGIKVPVQNIFGFQTIYVKKLEEDFFRIHDGGETLGLASQKQNVLSKGFEEKLISICKARKISKNKNILSIDCPAKDFQDAFMNMFAAITLINE